MENHTPPAWHNKPYLSVGDVSEICHLSRRTLRHYDNIGLLKPEKVDAETGYRYYSRSQIFFISVIQDLKALGFSLPEIKQALFPEDLDLLSALYTNKLQTINSEIKRLSRIQERIDYRLKLIEKIRFLEKNIQDFSDLYIELKQLPDRKIVFTKYVSSFEFERIALRIQELYSLVEKYQLEAYGPYMLIFHEDYEHPENTLLEMSTSLKDSENKDLSCIRVIPAGLFVSTIQFGPHEKTLPSYKKLLSWIDAHGYRITGPVIKIYIKSLAFTNNTDKILTEIQVPIKKISDPPKP